LKLRQRELQDAGQGLEDQQTHGMRHTNVPPMAKFGKMEKNRNANKSLADTYGLLDKIFDAEVVRVDIRVGFVVSLRPKWASSFDSTLPLPCQTSFRPSGLK